MTITTTTLTRAAGLCRRRRRPAVHRRPDQPPPPERPLHHHDRVRGPRDREDLHGRPLADRHHRHLPAPGPADRRARPDRVRRARRRLPRHPGIQVIGVFVLPDLAASQPGYVNDVLAVATSGTPVGDIGPLQTLINGAASPTSSAASSSASPSSGPASSPAGPQPSSPSAPSRPSPPSSCPSSPRRLFAIPAGVALIGLGYSLWREQRTARTSCPARSAHSSTRPAPNDHPPPPPAPPGRPGPTGRPGGCRSRWSPSSCVPAIAGSLRLVELAGGPQLMPAEPPADRLARCRWSCTSSARVGYAVLGAFQFSAALRRRRPGWHRAAGRVLVVLGLAVAFSALWMTLFYPRQPGTGVLAYVFRLAFGSGMAASIVLGFTAIRRRDVARHRAWMTRAYALALGAGTQVFTQGHRTGGLRHQRAHHRPEPRRGLGHQPRRRRVRHPPTRPPPDQPTRPSGDREVGS